MTSPHLPDDELPFDASTLECFLSGLGSDMVLVGGQALAFWMDRYDIDPEGRAVSNDADALGKLERAAHLAAELGGELLPVNPKARTSLVAQIRLGHGRRRRNVDVLHLLFTTSGQTKSSEFTKRVWQRSVDVEWKPGSKVRVMHPIDVLESRAHNAVGLIDEKGPHVVTQLEWAVEVAHEAMLRVATAEDPGTQRLGQMIQDVYTLAASAVGRKAHSDHGIELLEAIPIEAISELRPEHRPQLERVQRLIDERSRPPGDPPRSRE